MKKNAIVFILTVFTLFNVSEINAQSLYELRFADKAGNKYQGLLTFYDETNSHMRIAYYSADGVYRVVNVEYIGTSMVEEGINYFMLFGSNPTFITEGGNETYNPDSFVWMWDDTGEMLIYATDDPEFSEESFNEVDYYQELDVSNLTEDYLRQFYSSDEEELENLLLLANGADYTLDNSYNYTDVDYSTEQNTNNTNTNTNNQGTNSKVTMHLIVVANTQIGDIGASCEVDKKNLISEFEGVSEALKIDFKPYVIDGKDFSKETVTRTLNSLNPGKNDVVLFVYTGHGFRWSDQNEKYPNMDLRYSSFHELGDQSYMSLSEVYSIIQSKGARLNLVFGDCCNADIGMNQMTTSNFLGNRLNPNYKPEKLKRLFLESSGNIIATAASPGQVSWSNSAQGGFFIYSFLQSFHQEISFITTDEADWEGMLKNTMEQAAYKTSKSACSSCSLQNGLSTIKLIYK